MSIHSCFDSNAVAFARRFGCAIQFFVTFTSTGSPKTLFLSIFDRYNVLTGTFSTYLEHGLCNFANFIQWQSINCSSIRLDFSQNNKQWQQMANSRTSHRHRTLEFDAKTDFKKKNLVLDCALEIYPHLNLMSNPNRCWRPTGAEANDANYEKLMAGSHVKGRHIHFKSTRAPNQPQFDKHFRNKIAARFRSTHHQLSNSVDVLKRSRQ